MKAAVATDFGEPLEIQDLPVAGSVQVRARTAASGLCRTGLHAAGKAGGAGAALVLAAAPRAFARAYRSLDRGGRPVTVPPPAGAAVHIPIAGTVLGGITGISSIVGTRQDLSEVSAPHAAGRTRTVAESRLLYQFAEPSGEGPGGRAGARPAPRFRTQD
jgi:D-arabinose 1-dehydrogenase-like Zn-dependent alcohol dehydrogenase